MTKNQIEYLKLRETQRSNRVSAELKQQELGNAFAINTLSLDETARHNRAVEANTANDVSERVRHNIVSELHSEMSVNEQRRANLAREAETKRSNIASERLGVDSLSATRQYHSQQVGLGYSQLAESSRANQAREAETTRSNQAAESIKLMSQQEITRSNLAKESETHRHNVVSEAISRFGNTLQSEGQSETKRHNQASEVNMFIQTGSKVASDGVRIASQLAALP